jgi:hypothetical protein
VSLSVCCTTNDPGPRVRALLGQVRDVADEILVAVDSRVDPERLGHYAAVADGLFRYEFAEPHDRIWAWIHEQCRGDWILRLDGDMVVNPDLVARLPELLRARDVFQYWIPCQWLFPDARHWLNQPPWAFDANRLIRNDPATMWFPALSHLPVEPVWPSRFLDAGFYHLDYLLKTRAQREAKVAYHLAIRDGERLEGSDSDMPLYFLPEDAFGAEPIPVPEHHLPAIEQVLAADGEEIPGPPPAEIRLATRAEIDRFWPERSLSSAAYRATIDPLDPPLLLEPREHRPVHVKVRNDGDDRWPWTPREPEKRAAYWPQVEHRPLVRLAYRWLDTSGRLVVGEGFRTPLPATVEPGESAVVPVVVVAPDEPGSYWLEIDLVHEFVRWFECAVGIEVKVERPRR